MKGRCCVSYGAPIPRRVVKVAAAVVVSVMAFLWQSPAVGQTPDGAKPVTATGDVWAASVAMRGKPAVLGQKAGNMLKEACQNREPDLVLMFDFKYAIKNAEDKKSIMDGVAESFDKKIIYGSTIHGPSMTADQQGHVGVLALGGIKMTAAKVMPEKGTEEAAYTALAEALKAQYNEAAGKGRLVLIFGACVPRGNSQKIVDAFTMTLGKDVLLLGSPAPEAGFQYYQGELLNGKLMAILIAGDFTCDFGMANGSPKKRGDQSQDPDKIMESAEEVMKTAVGDKKASAALIFVTHCYTRNHSLANGRKQRPTGPSPQDEYKVITKDITAPLFGVMDDIEIGHAATGEPAVAKEDQISVCVISRKAK